MRRSLPLTALLAAAVALAGPACGSDDKSDESATSTTAAAPVTTSSVPDTTATTATTSTAAGSVTMAGETVPVARLLTVAAGLCESAAQAPTDVEAAEKTFNGRSHDGLHLIARGLEQIDRAAAAVLLEAKQKVEGDFSRSAAGAQVATDLRHLHEVTVSSLARFNVTAGACPPGS
ncbi:MAG: hypothetical protein AB1679_24425 [Actinomycetota bacterium]|jgi:hypothetical protein